MKAIKLTEGTMATLDKIFDFDTPVDVTKDEANYLKKVFGDAFKFDGVEEKPEVSVDTHKAEVEKKATTKK